MNTLVIYESHHGTTAKTALMIGTVLGHARVVSVENAPQDLDIYHTVVAVFCLYGMQTAQRTKDYFSAVKHQLKDRNLALVGVGLSEKQEFPAICEQLKGLSGCDQPLVQFVQGELRISRLTEDERVQIERFSALAGQPLADRGFYRPQMAISAALTIRQAFRCPDAPMPREELLPIIDAYLNDHRICALATGKGEWVRCTPLEYLYTEGKIYLFTEGGLKFKGIWENPTISLSISDKDASFDKVTALQITGEAKLVSTESQEYRRICAARGLDQQKLSQLPMMLFLVRITPQCYEMLSADFRKKGYGSRQEVSV